jgi:hypothetical protein
VTIEFYEVNADDYDKLRQFLSEQERADSDSGLGLIRATLDGSDRTVLMKSLSRIAGPPEVNRSA